MVRVIRGADVPFLEAPGAEERRFGKFLVSGDTVSEAPVTLGRFVYPPGARSNIHTHTYGTEIYYCLAGQLEAHVEGQVYRLGPGDLVIIPPGHQHYAYNPGPQRAEFVAVHSPPVEDYEHFRKEWKVRSSEIDEEDASDEKNASAGRAG